MTEVDAKSDLEIGEFRRELRDGAHVGESDLRSWCGLRLARFKIPKSIRFVDALPRTASGKIKRGLLRNAKYPDR